jgi:SAM-dependent methyltransferase
MDYSKQTKHIYNEIANEFDNSRYRVWPCVKKFLDIFEPSNIILDIGCGNGKNMLYRNDLIIKGIDFSDKLVSICKNKGLDVVEASMTSIPFEDNTFDGGIVIASYHHLSNDIERKQALDEIYRILKIGSSILIVVWAIEQPAESKFHFTKSDEIVKWKSVHDSTIVYDRYYHIYAKDELREEISRLKPEFKIIDEYIEKGNWVISLKK